MDRADLFRQRFKLTDHHDLEEPLDAARFMKLVFEFMKDVRAEVWSGTEGQQLMKEFCDMIQHQEVWHLAQTVVPEFRLSFQDQ